MRNPICISLLTATLSLPALGQNPIQHYAGTSFTSRGTARAQATTLLQRLPSDQACGRTAIHSVVHSLQNDALAAANGNWTVEVRGNDGAGPRTGSPDMSATGLIASLPMSFNFPAGSTAYRFTTTPATPIRLRSGALGPAGDLYFGIALPAVAGSPNLSLHMAADTSSRAAAVGYTGAAGIVGLAWEAIGGANPALYSPGALPNPAWDIGVRLVDETLQPFLDRAPAPFFGYGSLFPSAARGDLIGFRTVAQGTNLDVSVLLVGASLTAPIAIPGLGNLCLPVNAVPVAASLFNSTGTAGTVAARFGPYPAVAGVGDLYFQALSYKFGGGNRLSTACRVNM